LMKFFRCVGVTSSGATDQFIKRTRSTHSKRKFLEGYYTPSPFLNAQQY
jgi:hypothetical protein